MRPSAGGDALARALDISGEQLAGNARQVEQRLAEVSTEKAASLAQLNLTCCRCS